MVLIHYKCRLGTYPRSIIRRFPVPDCKVPWNNEYKEYNPTPYTDPNINGKPWADPNIGSLHFKPKWNDQDGILNRKSYMGSYTIENNFPLNPIGRTGIQGRGVLGRWGPNHAADPIITRWKNNANDNSEKLLQFVAIKRRDTGEWAIPGGMVDPGEEFSVAAIREFQEEAMNFLEATEEMKETLRRKFKTFFSAGTKVYTGYVDDPRNTDNAWMETTAYNYHDETGSVVGGLDLQAGDDAVGVRWVDVTPDLNLYASHKDIIDKVSSLHVK